MASANQTFWFSNENFQLLVRFLGFFFFIEKLKFSVEKLNKNDFFLFFDFVSLLGVEGWGGVGRDIFRSALLQMQNDSSGIFGHRYLIEFI